MEILGRRPKHIGLKKDGPSCIISSVYFCLCVFLILWWRATLSVRGGQFVSVVWELTNHRCVSEVLAIPCVLIHETSWFLVPTSNFSVCQAELHQTGIQAVAVSPCPRQAGASSTRALMVREAVLARRRLFDGRLCYCATTLWLSLPSGLLVSARFNCTLQVCASLAQSSCVLLVSIEHFRCVKPRQLVQLCMFRAHIDCLRSPGGGHDPVSFEVIACVGSLETVFTALHGPAIISVLVHGLVSVVHGLESVVLVACVDIRRLYVQLFTAQAICQLPPFG